jgi:hypothetical protein
MARQTDPVVVTRSIRGTLLVAMLAAFLVGSALIGVEALPANAATDTVTNCNNSGTGSLRQTVADASAGDTIDFDMSPSCSTIDDPTGTILITKSLTIAGPGADALALSGLNESQSLKSSVVSQSPFLT